MRRLHKVYISLGLLAGLGMTPAFAADAGLQLAAISQADPNWTPGGGTRELSPEAESARLGNEGEEGDANRGADPNWQTGFRQDYDDQDQGFDSVMILSVLLLGLAFMAMILIANRRRRPVDSQHP